MPVLGTCDKKQYEHSGPHEEITEHGQPLPPFPCQNWRPSEWAEKPGETTTEVDDARHL